MATVNPGEGMSGEPFEVPDHNTMLLDYYRGEGYSVVTDEEAAALAAEVPARSALKADWIDYAVAQGADADEAAALTKDQLVAQFGGE